MNIHTLIKRCIALFVLNPVLLSAQVSDDFSDGELLHQPVWTGDLQLFRVNNSFQLQLDDEGAGKASLFTPVQLTEVMEWQCWVRLSFSPSSNNHSRIYLAAETPDTSGIADGIFLQLGESGSDDAVRLMIQEGGDTSTLIRGSPGKISSSFKCRLRVTLGVEGLELEADYTGGKDFQPEGSCTQHPAPNTRYLGVYCKYTTSNSKKFYFDDFYAGPPLNDTVTDVNRYDVLINEIMADPSPSAGLPEHEYLELFNNTSQLIDLYDWKLIIGGSEKSLTGAKIDSGGYLIIAKDDAFSELNTLGYFWGLESFSLSNAGQEIMLLNHRDELIDHVYYRDHWHSDQEKDDGGFSLELINPQNPCLGKENWSTTDHFSGGTPGQLNSVFDMLDVPLRILRVCAPDKDRIKLVFNQSMHTGMGMNPGIFSINHDIEAIEAMLPADPWFTSFILYPQKEIAPGLVYEISCNSFIYNCAGDSVLLSEDLFVGLSRPGIWNDIIINEVLFDPFPGGCDFIELYNRSDGVISLAGMKIGSIHHNPPSPPDTSFLTIRDDCLAMLPGTYMAISENNYGLEQFYDCPDYKNLYFSEDLPSLNKEGGHIIVVSPEGVLLDAFSYSEDMHYPLLNTSKGVSLERIHYNEATQDENNWHSASFRSGFATPGYRNSQHSDGSEINSPIHVFPRVFTPGYDGINDYINIHYNFSDPGRLASMIVFNASGYPIRQLTENELLGTSGIISWNGLCDDNSRAAAGIYIIMSEITGMDGRVLRYKNTAVIAP